MKAKRKFAVRFERDEMGYDVAADLALRGCHSQARNLGALLKRAREGIALYLDVGEEDGDSLEGIGVHQIFQ